MIPRVIIEGLGDVTQDVIFSQSEFDMAAPQASPSRIVLRDLGQTRRSFVTGKRITVDLPTAGSEETPVFTDNFDTDHVSAWPGWTDYAPFTQPGSTRSKSVSGGRGHMVLTIPGGGGTFDNWAEEWINTVPDVDLTSLPSFVVTCKFRIPQPPVDTVANVGLFFADTDAGLYVSELKNDGTFHINAYTDDDSLFPTPESDWDFTADHYLEFTYSGSSVEIRHWSGTRPSAPLGTIDASSGFSAGVFTADAWYYGSGAGSVDIAWDQIKVAIPPPVSGDVIWAGYLLRASRQFWFDVDVPDTMNRRWAIDLTDLNILLGKRIVHKVASPKVVQGPVYRSPTYDDTIIAELLENWLDLSADDLDVSSLVERVGLVNPSSGSCVPPDQSFYPFNGAMQWGEAMEIISQVPAAIYGMLPGQPLGATPFGRLFYADVDSADAPFELSDNPGPGQVGYRECTIWEDGSNLVNDDFGWGAGKGSDHMVFDRRESSGSIADHGLWQQGDVLFNVWCQDTIEKITDSVVNGSPGSRRGHKNPITTVELIVDHDGLKIGQKVRFISEEYGVDMVLPIRRVGLTWPVPSQTRYKLLLSEALDRWGFEDPPLPFPTFRGPRPPQVWVQPPPPDPNCWINAPVEVDGILDDMNRSAIDDAGCTSFGAYEWQKIGGDTHFGSSREGGSGWPTLPERFDTFVLDGRMGMYLPLDYRYSNCRAGLTLPIHSTEDDIVMEFDAFVSQATQVEPDGTLDGFGSDMFTFLNLGFSGLLVTLGDETGPFYRDPDTLEDFYRQRTIIQVTPLGDFENDNGNLHESETGIWRAGVHVKLESKRFSTTQKTVKITVGAFAMQQTLDYDDNHFSPRDLTLSVNIGAGLMGEIPHTPGDPLDRYPAGEFYARIDNLKIQTTSGTCDVVPRCE